MSNWLSCIALDAYHLYSLAKCHILGDDQNKSSDPEYEMLAQCKSYLAYLSPAFRCLPAQQKESGEQVVTTMMMMHISS